MTNTFDPGKRPEGPPLSGGPSLVRDTDGFMVQKLPEAARSALAFKEAYVLELLQREADPQFSFRDEYLRAVIKRVSQRFGPSGKCGALVYPRLPSPKALRYWHQKYVEANCDPLALLPGKPRPNRAKARSEG